MDTDPARAVVVPLLVNLNVASLLLLVLVTELFTLTNANVQISSHLAVIHAVHLQHAVLLHRNVVLLQSHAVLHPKLAVLHQHAVHLQKLAAQNQHVVLLQKLAAIMVVDAKKVVDYSVDSLNTKVVDQAVQAVNQHAVHL